MRVKFMVPTRSFTVFVPPYTRYTVVDDAVVFITVVTGTPYSVTTGPTAGPDIVAVVGVITIVVDGGIGVGNAVGPDVVENITNPGPAAVPEITALAIYVPRGNDAIEATLTQALLVVFPVAPLTLIEPPT